jgi:hypothetical protein
MSHNPGDAATTAREQETEQTQAQSAEQNAPDAQPESSEQQPTGNAPTASAEPQAEVTHSTGTQPSESASDTEPRAQTGATTATDQEPRATGTDNQAQAASSSETPTPVQSAASPATPQPTGDADEGVASSANVDAATASQTATKEQFEERPDLSDQSYRELLPKLLALFNNNREQLGRALGLHRSTVDRWLNGKSRPNTSTILRMRRLAQERNVE